MYLYFVNIGMQLFKKLSSEAIKEPGNNGQPNIEKPHIGEYFLNGRFVLFKYWSEDDWG